MYESLCAGCHGVAGRPSESSRSLLDPPPADLTSSNASSDHALEDIKTVIRIGRQKNMLHFEGRLSEEQIEALAHYVLTLRAAGGDSSDSKKERRTKASVPPNPVESNTADSSTDGSGSPEPSHE